MKRVFALSALPLVVWGMNRDGRGIPKQEDNAVAPARRRRQVLSKPLVIPQKNSTIDCFFDDLKQDHTCYFSEHNYSASHFVARCDSETFKVSTCECELSALPNKGIADNYEQEVSQFQPCDMCQLVETSDGGWAVEYNCSNILKGKYASYRNSSAFEEEREEDSVRFEETTVASPFKQDVDPNISLGDSNSGGSNREESTTSRKDNSTENAPTEAPSGRVFLTMHKVTRRPSPAPIDGEDRGKVQGGSHIRRRR